jgi:hypothetical protein
LAGADAAELLGAAVLVPVVDVVPVAALAIAAPPPTRAPLTASVVIRGFRRGIGLTSFCACHANTIRPVRRSGVGMG